MKISKEEFKKYLNSFIAFDEYVDKLDSLGISIWEREEFSYLCVSYQEMLEKFVGVDTDVISFFLWEWDRGRYEDIAYCEDNNGNQYHIRNIDELVDYLEVISKDE